MIVIASRVFAWLWIIGHGLRGITSLTILSHSCSPMRSSSGRAKGAGRLMMRNVCTTGRWRTKLLVRSVFQHRPHQNCMWCLCNFDLIDSQTSIPAMSCNEAAQLESQVTQKNFEQDKVEIFLLPQNKHLPPSPSACTCVTPPFFFLKK